jgi:hypothetical protein
MPTGQDSLFHPTVGVFDLIPEPTGNPTTPLAPKNGTPMVHNTMAFNSAYQHAPPPLPGPPAPANQGWYNNF